MLLAVINRPTIGAARARIEGALGERRTCVVRDIKREFVVLGAAREDVAGVAVERERGSDRRCRERGDDRERRLEVRARGAHDDRRRAFASARGEDLASPRDERVSLARHRDVEEGVVAAEELERVAEVRAAVVARADLDGGLARVFDPHAPDEHVFAAHAELHGLALLRAGQRHLGERPFERPVHEEEVVAVFACEGLHVSSPSIAARPSMTELAIGTSDGSSSELGRL